MRDTAPGRAGRREWTALVVLGLEVLLLAVDGPVPSLAVPALSIDLTPTATQLLWISDAYSFALAGLLVPIGVLGDRIGRKLLLIAAPVPPSPSCRLVEGAVSVAATAEERETRSGQRTHPARRYVLSGVRR